MRAFVSLKGSLNDPIRNQREWHSKNQGTNGHGPKNLQCLQVKPASSECVFHTKSFWKMMRMAQYPKSEIIFPPQDDWPDGAEDVVKRNCNDCRNLAAPEYPREQNGEQGFETRQRSKPPEYPKCDATSHGMGSITKLTEMLDLLLNKPLNVAQCFHWILSNVRSAGSSSGAAAPTRHSLLRGGFGFEQQ